MQNQEDIRPTDIHYYEDIIDLPHYFPPDRIRMPRSKRAAQFMAFKPFPGYDKMIERVEYEYIRDNYPDMLKWRKKDAFNR